MENNCLRKFWDSVGMQMQKNYPYYLCPAMGKYKSREFVKFLDEVSLDRDSFLLKTDSFEEAYGSENITDSLLKISYKVINLDISFEILSMARQKDKKGLFKGVVTDISQMPFKEDSISLIFSSSTYGYLDDIKEGLQQAFRVLEPGGIVLVSLNNRKNYLFRFLTKLYHSLGFIPFPVSRFYHSKEMEDILRNAGFTVEDKEAIVHIPPFFNMCSWFLGRYNNKVFKNLSRWIMNSIIRYSDSQLKIRSFSGWYILFKARKPIDDKS